MVLWMKVLEEESIDGEEKSGKKERPSHDLTDVSDRRSLEGGMNGT